MRSIKQLNYSYYFDFLIATMFFWDVSGTSGTNCVKIRSKYTPGKMPVDFQKDKVHSSLNPSLRSLQILTYQHMVFLSHAQNFVSWPIEWEIYTLAHAVSRINSWSLLCSISNSQPKSEELCFCSDAKHRCGTFRLGRFSNVYEGH